MDLLQNLIRSPPCYGLSLVSNILNVGKLVQARECLNLERMVALWKIAAEVHQNQNCILPGPTYAINKI